MVNKLDKKSLLYLSIVIIVAILTIGLIWYFSQASQWPKITEEEKAKPSEKTYEEIISDLTAPEEAEIEPIPEKTIKDLTAPEGAKPLPLPEEVIKNLTAPKQ